MQIEDNVQQTESPEARFYKQRSKLDAQNLVPGSGHDPMRLRPGDRYWVVQQFLSTHPNLDVLECGTGSLRVTSYLASLSKTYTGFDITVPPGGVEAISNLRFQIVDLNYRFPVDDGSVDLVVALMIFEHLFDPFHSFSESARILRRGGSLIVNVPIITSLRRRLQILSGHVPHTSVPYKQWFEDGEYDGGHLHYFSIRSVLDLAAYAGLKFTSWTPVGKMLGMKKRFPGLLASELSFTFLKYT